MRRILALFVASAAALAPPTKPVTPFHVHVGGGKLGLSLVVPAVAASGVNFAVVDTPKDPAWAALAKGSEFPVRVNGVEICRLTAVGDGARAGGGNLVLSDDDATLAALVAQATTLSCSLGPSLGPVMTKLLKHTSHKPILYACENDHDAVAALTQALEGKATVVDCVVDRVSTDRAVTADGVAVTAAVSYTHLTLPTKRIV